MLGTHLGAGHLNAGPRSQPGSLPHETSQRLLICFALTIPVKGTQGLLLPAMLWLPPEERLTTEDFIVVPPEVSDLGWSVVKFIPVGCQDEPERESMTKGLWGKQKS